MQRHSQLLVCFVFLVARLAFSGEDKQKVYEAARQRAMEVSDIFGVGPLQILATFHLHTMGGGIDGTYRYRQLSKGQYLEEIQSPSFNESIVYSAGQRYLVRSRQFEPLPISYLRELFQFAIPADAPVSKVSTTVQMGRNLKCYVVERGQGITEFSGFEACFDAETAVLASRETSFNTEVHRAEYSKFLSDGDRLFPTEMRMLRNGNPVVEVSVDSISHPPTDAKLLDPPPNASKEDVCKRFQPAEPVYSDDYFRIRSSHLSGSVIIMGSVDDRGKVRETEIQQPADPKVNQDALKAIREVRTHPAKCDGHAIASFFRLQIWFSPALHPDLFQSFR